MPIDAGEVPATTVPAGRRAREAERIQREAGRILVSCDGLCEPRNPGGTATFGWVARRGGELLASDCGVVARGHRATNNLAEYTAIIEALRWLDEAGHAGETIVLRSDSQLAIYQLDGMDVLTWHGPTVTT